VRGNVLLNRPENVRKKDITVDPFGANHLPGAQLNSRKLQINTDERRGQAATTSAVWWLSAASCYGMNSGQGQGQGHIFISAK